MKKYYTSVFALLCLIACKTNKPVGTTVTTKEQEVAIAQENTSGSVNDTLDYAKTLIADKAKYINKELGVLLNDLKIPVKSYAILNSRVNIDEGIRLSFEDQKTTIRKQAQDDNEKKPAYLYITWKTPIPASKHTEIIQKSTSKGDWQSAEQEFYSKQIVGNIE